MLPLILALTQVAFVDAWSISGLESKINSKIQELEATAAKNKQEVDIEQIQLTLPTYTAMITYSLYDE